MPITRSCSTMARKGDCHSRQVPKIHGVSQPTPQVNSQRRYSPPSGKAESSAWRHLTSRASHGLSLRASPHHAPAGPTASGPHRHGPASPASRPLARKRGPESHLAAETTAAEEPRKATAAKKTAARRVRIFITLMTPSREPARERRGLQALSGPLRRPVTLIGSCVLGSTHASTGMGRGSGMGR